MTNINDLEKLYNLVLVTLKAYSPVLSGNMVSSIHVNPENQYEFTIVIDAPYYDLNVWKKSHIIVPSKQNHMGRTSYAQSVNDNGGFGKQNKSKHWVNRVCNECVKQIASEIGAVVDNGLEL